MFDKMFHNMFFLPDSISIPEKIIRPVLVYFFLVIGIRLAGKRQLAQLNAFDLVVLLILSNTVQNAIIGDDNSLSGGVIGAATLLVLNYVVNRVLYSNRKLEALVEGKADVLIENGKLDQRHIENELITMQELEAAARKQGFASLGEVDRAVLESGGTISFKGKTPAVDDLRHRELVEQIHELRKLVSEVHKVHVDLAKIPPKSAS